MGVESGSPDPGLPCDVAHPDGLIGAAVKELNKGIINLSKGASGSGIAPIRDTFRFMFHRSHVALC
jgi:hypothetical protein